jgi:hypothetical protein
MATTATGERRRELITAAQRRRGVGHPQATRADTVTYDREIDSTEYPLSLAATTSVDASPAASIAVAGDIAP